MTAYRYVRVGLLPAVQRAGTWMIRPADVTEFRQRAQEQPVAGAGRRRTGVLRDRLLACLLAGDEASAWSVLDRALSTGYSPTEIYLLLLAPALRSVGDGWEEGALSVGDEHRSSAVAVRLVGRMGPSFVRRGRSLGTVVVGAAPGDVHSLPASLLADVVRAHGYRVVDLGGNVPIESFTVAAAAEGVVAVGVSVSDGERLAVAGEVAAAVRAAAAVPVLIGGPATDASVVAIGADGWAPDAAAAAAVIDPLRGRAT
jgi:methanogenic corrinoid protein MtbC1